MAGASPLLPGGTRWVRWMPWVLAGVLLAGFALRASAGLLPDCIAGQDGAYYYVQVRGLLRGEGLPIPDFPLLFYAVAALSWGLSAFMDMREANPLVVRWVDTLVPLTLAVPVLWFVRIFCRDHARAALAVMLVGLLAVGSGNVLIMTGGMIKNGVALPFCLAYAYYAHCWLGSRDLRPALAALLCFLAASLIHISAAALNGLLTLALLLLGLSRLGLRIRLGLVAGIALAVGLGALVEPARGGRVLELLFRPWSAFAAGGPEIAYWPQVWMGQALGLLGLFALRRHWRGLEEELRILLGASTLTVLALSCPFLRPELLERLSLVGFVAGLIPAAFLVCRDALGPFLVAPVVLFSLLHGVLAVKTLRLTALTRPALEDLHPMRALLPSGRPVVLVRPGLQWWVVWELDVRFSTSAHTALRGEPLFLLEESAPGAFGRAPARFGPFPGATLRDGERLRSETFTTLRQGAYFRLSQRALSPADAGPGLPDLIRDSGH